MISVEFRLKFKNDLGDSFRYSSKVQARLEASEVFTTKDKVHSVGHIQNVFKGFAENTDIELAIHEVYEEQITRNRKLAALKAKHKSKPDKAKQSPTNIG